MHHDLLLAPFDSLCNNPADVHQPGIKLFIERRPFGTFLKKRRQPGVRHDLKCDKGATIWLLVFFILNFSGLTQQEVAQENEKVIQQTKEYERKIKLIVGLIEDMERQYEDSKRFIAIQRYRLMKTMIKSLINNQWI